MVLKYRSWFWVSLALSTFAGVISVALYLYDWQASLLFGYISGVAQVVATLQLVEGLDGGPI